MLLEYAKADFHKHIHPHTKITQLTRTLSSSTYTGANFYTTGSLHFNGVAISSNKITSWSHSEIRFLAPLSVGTNLRLEINVGGVIQRIEDFSYAPARIEAISGPGTNGDLASTTGGTLANLVVLTGKGFYTAGSGRVLWNGVLILRESVCVKEKGRGIESA